ncbi:MAG: hypothetical protein M2R45_05425 [Verrucomicrobia subdivision 3 bacterium]|nr:hypothetical protein [Limisphaerales bacterium]MCS1413003.1 hypothetical protein [Limisphaerales bacterium]
MNFLYPLFLAGSLAIVLPVIFHLIRRSTRNKVSFSTIRFLEPSPPRLTRKSRFEHLWLLLLRCLILLLLALAFARPYIKRALDPTAAAENPQRNIILLDASASMRRGQAWNEAQTILSREVNRLDSNALVSAYTFDTQLHPIVTFEQWDSAPTADRAIQIINQAGERQPTWKATHLGKAILTAVDLLEESTRIGEHDKENLDWRVMVIGDLQSGMLLDGIQGFEWPKGCVVQFHAVDVDGDTNVGIHAVPSLAAYASLVEHESVRIRISNATSSEAETFRFGWVRDETADQMASQTEVYIPPGKSRVLDAPGEPTDFPPDILKISGDDHDFDNTVWRVPLRARESKVIYLGWPAENNPERLLFYLDKAFQQTQRHVVSAAVFPPNQPLLEEALQDARLIVISEPLSAELADQVGRVIEAGTTGLLALHQDGLEPTLQSLVQDTTIRATPSASQRYALFGEIDFQHPLFVSFADPRFSDFTKIRFWTHHTLDIESCETARIIAQFDNGLPAIVQFPRGSGSLFVTAFGWQPQRSQFALSTKFVPFLYALLDFGDGIHEVKSHYFVGQEVDLTSLTSEAELLIQTPENTTIDLGDNLLFRDTSEPGIYTIQTANSPIRFAVNLHPSESSTAPILEETLLGLGIPMGQTKASEKVNPIVEEAQSKLKATEIESSQKFWRWMVLAALILATLETGSSAILSRRPSVTG